MLERLLILLIAALVVGLGWWLLRVFMAWRLARLAAQPATEQFADELAGAIGTQKSASPALLYFTTDDCAQCKFQQRPILDRLAAATTLSIVTINAIESQSLARHYGILTVPSTVLLDAQRKPVAINHGLAHLEKLRTQVSALG